MFPLFHPPPLITLASNNPSTAGVWIGLLLAAVVALFCGCIIYYLNHRLARLKRGAIRFAQGDLSQRLSTEGPPEIAGLAEALNRMASQLEERIAAVVNQRNELQAVLASMVEGVLAIDTDERVLSMNQAAAHLLGLRVDLALSRPIQELVRNPALQELVAQSLSSHPTVQGHIVLRVGTPGDAGNPGDLRQDHHLAVSGTALVDDAGRRIGAVIVLHDVTDIRRLEAVRRDFVANVSHEIKTPVAAIKAAAETIIDAQEESNEDSVRFLHIITRQADRLNALVEDLLALARIEQDAEQQKIQMEPASVAQVIDAAVESCRSLAEERSVRLQTICPPDLMVKMNHGMLERAVLNLVDNAVKYCPADTQVRIVAEAMEQQVVISISDQGPGIEPEHLPRIFERFYRVDKARSRKVGGTGLGLAIVKHVAQAHHGRVSVESTREGSTFRIHLPI
ncbi:MAG: ATP-binding protein [Phycisphaeraceae bacterium]